MTLLNKIQASLYFKIVIPMVIIIFLVVTAIAILFLFKSDQRIEKQINSDIKNIIDTIYIASQGRSNYIYFNRIVGALSLKKETAFILVVNTEKDEIVASGNFSKNNSQIFSYLNERELEIYSAVNKKEGNTYIFDSHGETFYGIENIEFVGDDDVREVVFSIFVAYDARDIYIESYRTLMLILFIFSLGMMLVLVAVFFVNKLFVINPLHRIIGFVNAQKHDDDVDVFLPDSNDEIGLLSKAYKSMLINNQEKERQLSDTRKYIDGITNNVPILLAYVDSDLCYRFANRNHERWLGLTNEEIINERVATVLGSEMFERIANYFERSFLGETLDYEETVGMAVSGARHVRVTHYPDVNDSGHVQGIFICIEDISLIKESERRIAEYAQEMEFNNWALEDEKERAEMATKAKSEFLASMSHEIRTPMNGVLGMINLMLKDSLSSDQTHRAMLAKSSAESLLDLINDILDFSKVEAGKLELEKVEFDLVELIGNFSETAAIRSQEKGVDLVLDLSGLEYINVIGDPGRLRQVLSNVVGNAVKFTKEGEILVAVYSSAIDDNSLCLSIDIKDTGIGIPEDKIDSLFDSFTQVDASTTRQYGGTGLGLAICKKICELMSGSISVVSEFGEGTCFSVRLMLSRSKHEKPLLPDHSIEGREILIIDDNLSTRTALVDWLTGWGAEVYALSGQLEFQDKIGNLDSPLDLILIDFELPNKQAENIVKSLSGYECCKNVKPVFMTNLINRGNIDAFSSLGVSSWFPKPVTFNDVNYVINELVTGVNLSQTRYHSDEETIESESVLAISENTRILLVEDNRINQEVAQGILSDFGLIIDVAENGIEAINLLRANEYNVPYAIILMDCQMPEMDGYEATKRIRKGDAGEYCINVPIIAMTANAMRGDKEKCIAAGMSDYLTKPIDSIELETKLENWLKKSEVSDKNAVSEDASVKIDKSEQNESHDVSCDSNQANSDQHSVKVNGMAENESEDQLLHPDWKKEEALGRVRKKPARLAHLVKLFLGDIAERMDTLEKDVNALMYENIVMTAHTIRGVSGNLSAANLFHYSSELENAAKASDEQAVQLNFAKVKVSCTRLIPILEAFVNELEEA